MIEKFCSYSEEALTLSSSIVYVKMEHFGVNISHRIFHDAQSLACATICCSSLGDDAHVFFRPQYFHSSTRSLYSHMAHCLLV